MGGGLAVDKRFSRRASVGLMVLAPNPLMRPEATDWRLLPPDAVVGDFARVVKTLAGDLLTVAVTSPSLAAGCTLLTFACRDCVVAVKVEMRGASAPADVDG